MYPRNNASPEPIAIGAVVAIADGTVQTSGVTVRIKPIGVAEGDGAGTTAYSTDGIVEYTPTQSETNYTSFILIAKKTGCIPVAITVVTTASATAGTVTLADGVTHGGTTAMLRLGSSTSTPALYVTNSTGYAVNFTSSGTNGVGLYCVGNGAGHGIWANGGVTGAGFYGAGAYGTMLNGSSYGLHTTGTTSALYVNGAMNVTGATTLTGNVSLGGTLGVTGTTTLNALTVTNATTLSGAVSLGSTLGVTGATTFTGAITATNASNDIRGISVNDFTTAALTEIRTYLHGADVAAQMDASGYHKISDGTGTGQIDMTSGGVLVSTLDTQAKADVNAEVVDCLNTDTYAEPAQGTPGSTVTLAYKIGLTYKALINKHTQTSSQFSMYNFAGTVVDHKATVSDDGTTFTRSVLATGP